MTWFRSLISRFLSGSSMNQRIFRAAFAVGLCSVVVKILSMAKEIAVARVFGRSDAIDAFLAAFLIPSFLISTISQSMNAALVPTLVGVRERDGRGEAQKLLSSAMVCSILLLSGAMLVLGITAPSVLRITASNFGPEKMQLTLHLFYVLLPVIVFTGVGMNCASILNTTGRFTLPALTPILTPLCVCFAALWFGRRFGVWAITVASVAGALSECLSLIWLMQHHDYKFQLQWFGFTPAARKIAHQYGLVLLGAILSSSSGLVDQSMAGMLTAGSVSALVYGNRIISAVGQMVITALTTSLTPHYSEMIAKKDWAQCRRTIRTYAGLSVAIAAPITLGLIAASHPLVRILYQHGAFGPKDTDIVARVQMMYALGLPFYAAGMVLVRFISAMNRNDIVCMNGGMNLILDIVFNLICMKRWGVPGIALSTSLFYVGSFLFNFVMARHLLRDAIGAKPAIALT